MSHFLTLLLLPVFLFASDVDTIIKAIEDNLRGDQVYMKMTMTVVSKRGERNVEIESWAQGNDRSFVKILYPKKDKGITFLKIDNQMWQYIPKIERTIKIPSSMMLQSWMGSDFTNDDIVKESSLVDDYIPTLLELEGKRAVIELLPRPQAPVVWGKIVITADVETMVPIKDEFYDDDMQMVRVLSYDDVRRVGKRNLPFRMELRPLEANKKKNRTIVQITRADFDTPVDDAYFTKQALKRYSR